jgi:hypothetical protein
VVVGSIIPSRVGRYSVQAIIMHIIADHVAAVHVRLSLIIHLRSRREMTENDGTQEAAMARKKQRLLSSNSAIVEFAGRRDRDPVVDAIAEWEKEEL